MAQNTYSITTLLQLRHILYIFTPGAATPCYFRLLVLIRLLSGSCWLSLLT